MRIAVNLQSERIAGNPTITSLDGSRKASLRTIMSPSWTDPEREAFGVVAVEITPPAGHHWSGAIDNFSPVYEADEQPSLADRIAERRYVAEVSGTLHNGVAIATDDRSQAKITGAALAAKMDPGYSLRWKTGEGFVTLDADAIIALALAVRDHVQACFDREDELLQAVEGDTYTEAMLQAGWPN